MPGLQACRLSRAWERGKYSPVGCGDGFGGEFLSQLLRVPFVDIFIPPPLPIQFDCYIVGGLPCLGGWERDKAMKMDRVGSSAIFQVEFHLDDRRDFEYRYLARNKVSGTTLWEDKNFQLQATNRSVVFSGRNTVSCGNKVFPLFTPPFLPPSYLYCSLLPAP